MRIDITQTGHSAHQAVDADGRVLSQHARQDQALEAVVNAGGGEVRTAQTLRVVVHAPEQPDPEPDPEPEPQPEPEPDPPVVPDPEPQPEPEPDPEPGPQPGGFIASTLTEANTGHRGSLTRTGSVSTSRDGQVIEGLDITGNLVIRHRGVTIRDCRIRHASGYGITAQAGVDVGRPTIEYCTIDGLNQSEQLGILLWSAVIHRCLLVRQRVGVQVRHNSIVSECVMGQQHVTSDSHNNGLSIHGGQGNVIRDNRLAASTSAALALYPRLEAIRDVLVERNLFEGVGMGVGIYAGYTSNHPYRDQNRDIRIVGNRWTGSFQHGTHLAWNGSQPGNRWEDNRWLDGRAI